MTKLLIGVLSLALVGVGGLVAAVDGFGDDRPVRSVSIPAGTTDDGRDISGPCDEPEHANDPRCTGVATSTNRADDGAARTVTTTGGAVDISGPCDEPEHANDPRCTGNAPAPTVTTGGREDISGPCDEAEHANDPRCTGTGTTTNDDRSGPGGGGRNDDRSGPGGGGGDRDRDDDRSGSNSGKS